MYLYIPPGGTPRQLKTNNIVIFELPLARTDAEACLVLSRYMMRPGNKGVFSICSAACHLGYGATWTVHAAPPLSHLSCIFGTHFKIFSIHDQINHQRHLSVVSFNHEDKL